MGVVGRGQPDDQFSLVDEVTLLARLSERQARLVSSVLDQAALADRMSAEKGQLARDLAGSIDHLQEVHHRVRNHLQMVTGVLSAQELTEASPTARRALRKSVGLLISIAAIHDLLARDPTAGRLGLAELVERLSDHLLRSMDAEGRIRLRVEAAPVRLNAQQATALVLILAELIGNAIEHGFPEGGGGTIRLRILHQADEVMLEVRDDGRGLPDELKPASSSGLGLGLVSRLAERELGGSVSARSDGGAVFSVVFPTKTREREP